MGENKDETGEDIFVKDTIPAKITDTKLPIGQQETKNVSEITPTDDTYEGSYKELGLIENSAVQRIADSKKGNRVEVTLSLMAKTSIYLKKTAKGSAKLTLLGIVEIFSNLDSIISVGSYPVIAIAYEIIKNGNENTQQLGYILFCIGVLMAVVSGQLPKGSIAKALKKPTTELKKDIKDKFNDFKNSL